MADVRSEFGSVGEVPLLSGGPWRRHPVHCGDQGFVVIEEPELLAFLQEPEVADGELSCQQFSVEGEVLDLGWRQLFGKKCQGHPTAPLLLLQHPPYMGVRGVHC